MELPTVMASLQIESESEEAAKSPIAPEVETTIPRTLRKRLGGPLINSLKRQRVQKKTPDTFNSEKEIINYYVKVNKKWSVKQTNLETIFEEPKESGDGNVVTMSGAKVRRSIVFSGRHTKAKKVKRNAKVKKHQLTKGKSIAEKKRKLTLEEVKLRLAESLDSLNFNHESSTTVVI